MRTAAKELHFPLAGVGRNLAVRVGNVPREDRAYYAPFAMNVRGVDPFEERLRGGSRPASLNLKVRSVSVETIFMARRIYASGALWFASRAGDVTDFNAGGDGEDPTRPASGNAAFSGRQGESITALFTTDGTTLYMSTANALWMMRGDVTSGPFSLVSPTVGCVSQDAWAWDGARLFVLSAHGVYAFAAGEPPRAVSESIPKELQSCTWATMLYDKGLDALNITSDKGNWTLEVGEGAWWPFDSSGEAKVAIGPFRTSGRDDEDGMLDTLMISLDRRSADVTAKAYSGKTATEALHKAESGAAQWSATVKAGFNNLTRPRLRGAWCVIVLQGTVSHPWAYEGATATVKQLGRLR